MGTNTVLSEHKQITILTLLNVDVVIPLLQVCFHLIYCPIVDDCSCVYQNLEKSSYKIDMFTVNRTS